jgi:hypothetical protein
VPKDRTVCIDLDAIVPDFDRLVAGAKTIRDQRHFAELADEAHTIAVKLRSAFRGRG